jgi:hypothetical protein
MESAARHAGVYIFHTSSWNCVSHSLKGLCKSPKVLAYVDMEKSTRKYTLTGPWNTPPFPRVSLERIMPVVCCLIAINDDNLRERDERPKTPSKA